MDKFSDQFKKDQLIDEVKGAMDDAEALLMATANVGGEKLAEVRAKTEQSLSIAKVRLAQARDELLVKAKAMTQATDVYVHNNPWRSIGFAASLGVVVGLLVGRR